MTGADAGPAGMAAETVELPADPLELSLECHRRGWTDGLPVIPPTRERVDAMLDAAGGDPLEVLGVLPPRRGIATVELVAVNAVLAGCMPHHFEAVVAAVQATADPAFNLDAVNATTHPVAMLVLLSGPAARAAGVHAGAGALGPGFPANLAIGRALRLVQLSIAGAWPGEGDRSEMGSPAKLAFCGAEREDATPWSPYHTTRGLDPADHAVTVFGCEAPHNIQDHANTSADGLLATIAGAMGQAGSNNIIGQGHPLLALGPEHAATLAGDGYSREDVQRHLFEQARFPRERLADEFIKVMKRRDSEVEDHIPIADAPETIEIFVTGGAGKHSAWMPSFGRATRPTTVSWTPHCNR